MDAHMTKLHNHLWTLDAGADYIPDMETAELLDFLLNLYNAVAGSRKLIFLHIRPGYDMREIVHMTRYAKHSIVDRLLANLTRELANRLLDLDARQMMLLNEIRHNLYGAKPLKIVADPVPRLGHRAIAQWMI
jgi:hypothetical protein